MTPVAVRQLQVTGAAMAKRIFASTPRQITTDKDLAHRRLNVAQLTRCTPWLIRRGVDINHSVHVARPLVVSRGSDGPV